MPPTTQTPQEAAWAAVFAVFMSQRKRMLEAAARLGLNPPQAMALNRLDPDEPLPMGRLAEYLHCDASNVTGIADRLEAAGLAERRPAAHDRRVKTLALTPEGIRLREQYLAWMREPPPVFAAMPDEDARAVHDALTRALATAP